MEILDIYDDNGNKTGRTIVRGDRTQTLNKHEHIPLSVIFIENDKGEFLIQKTSKEKGEKYSTTGGHVNHGETPIEAIKREVYEELGINIEDKEIEDYGYIIYDMPIRYIYYIKKNIDINSIKVQQVEVDYVKYMSISEINNLIENNQMLESHGILFRELLKRKNKVNAND